MTMYEDEEALRRQLAVLVQEHGDLDAAIAAMQANPFADQLSLRRLKKRKLQLKDAITRIESRLIPDLNA